MKLPSGILFVGSGVSSSVPLLHHALNDDNYTCFCCKNKSTQIDLEKNTRNNVSLLVRVPNKINSTEYHNILIDLGKTFREAAVSIFPKYQVSNIDSVLLTHPHDDAIGGFNSILHFEKKGIIPIYLNSETLNYLSNRYKKTIMNYTFEKNIDGSLNKNYRYEFNILDIIKGYKVKCFNHSELIKYRDESSDYYRSNNLKNVNFDINGLQITAIPMNHGQCICIGYCFHFSEQNVIYISDYTFPMLESSIQFFESMKNKKSILILDSISYYKTSNAHASIVESLNFIEEFSPDYVYFVGMSCSLEHNETNKQLYNQLLNLKKKGKCVNTVSIELAYDGLFLPIK